MSSCMDIVYWLRNACTVTVILIHLVHICMKGMNLLKVVSHTVRVPTQTPFLSFIDHIIVPNLIMDVLYMNLLDHHTLNL